MVTRKLNVISLGWTEMALQEKGQNRLTEQLNGKILLEQAQCPKLKIKVLKLKSNFDDN